MGSPLSLVTGGAGFIGSNIAIHLASLGHSVRVLDNLDTGHKRNIAGIGGIELHHGDVRDEELVDQLTSGVDYVFHLAASVGNKKSIDHPVQDAMINVVGTIHVLDAARKHGVKKVVFSSSAGIFGELRELPIRLDHPLFPDSPYGCSKLYGEKLCRSYTHLYGLKTVALRYFNVYGVHQRFDAYGNVIPIFAHRILKGEQVTIFGDGEQTRDFVNVKDVVQANVRSALAEDVTGAFNIGSGTRITINHLVELLKEASGRDFPVVYGEPRPGDVRHSLADIDPAREAFGFEPDPDIASGLREYWTWIEADHAKV